MAMALRVVARSSLCLDSFHHLIFSGPVTLYKAVQPGCGMQAEMVIQNERTMLGPTVSDGMTFLSKANFRSRRQISQ